MGKMDDKLKQFMKELFLCIFFGGVHRVCTGCVFRQERWIS